MNEHDNALGTAGLESVYDALARAIDAVGEGRSELFLVKLALLAAHRIGDERAFARLIEAAQRDL